MKIWSAFGAIALFSACMPICSSADVSRASSACGASKMATSAKYAGCRLVADAKAYKAETSPDYGKCSLAKFGDAEARDGLGLCPSRGDQAEVQGFLNACTSAVADALAGGPLPLDVQSCNASLSLCTAVCAAAVRPPLSTGQTTSFGSGSDGDLHNGALHSFTDNGDGTITDNVTKLMWEKKSNDGSVHDVDRYFTWSTGTNNMDGTIATTFLSSLNAGSGFAGYTDWRIPNRNELLTLTDLGTAQPATFGAFHSGCVEGCTVTSCSCTQASFYNSSTTNERIPTDAWTVNFNYGYTSYGDKTSGYFARAVRSGS